MGSCVCSGGAYSARIPWPRSVQLSPVSSVNQMPPVDTAIHTRLESRGSTEIDWIPGIGAAHPLLALGMSHSARSICQLWPWSVTG